MRRASLSVSGQTAEQQAQIVAVGLAHRGGRVVGGNHEFFDQAGEKFLAAGGGGLRRRWSVGLMSGSRAPASS